jgi:hypothetical protein
LVAGCLLLGSKLAFAQSTPATPPPTLPTTGAIAGVITDRRTGAPQAGVSVTATSPASPNNGAISNEQGAYALGGLPPGTYSVAFNPPGKEERDRVQVVAGKTTSVNLRLTAATIQGVVTDAASGDPVANAKVQATSEAWAVVTTMTDAQGRYRFNPVVPSSYQVSASLGDGWGQENLAVANGATVEVDLTLTPEAQLNVHEDVGLGELPRTAARGWLLEPRGSWSLGGALRILTAGSGLGSTPLRFGDAVLLGLNGAWSLTDWNQILAALTLLPMQPHDSREWAWQGNALGDRMRLGQHFAVGVQGAIGPVLLDHSLWEAASVGLEARANSNGTYEGSSMVFTARAGGDVTTYKLRDASDRTWLDDVFIDGQVTVRDPTGECCAAWLGTRYTIPVAWGPTQSSPDPQNGQFLAPRPWVTFRLGGTLSYIAQWDLWGELDVVSRGDLSRPGTTLPILDGSFSQTVLELGVTRHFGSMP